VPRFGDQRIALANRVKRLFHRSEVPCAVAGGHRLSRPGGNDGCTEVAEELPRGDGPSLFWERRDNKFAPSASRGELPRSTSCRMAYGGHMVLETEAKRNRVSGEETGNGEFSKISALCRIPCALRRFCRPMDNGNRDTRCARGADKSLGSGFNFGAFFSAEKVDM